MLRLAHMLRYLLKLKVNNKLKENNMNLRHKKSNTIISSASGYNEFNLFTSSQRLCPSNGCDMPDYILHTLPVVLSNE